MTSTTIDHNPWAGLSSYEDPAHAEHPLQFCGRDNETYDVAQLVANNIFVTLYGKSGTGKTSLLNAGVFPQLRERRYLPVSIRLAMDALDISFQQCLLRRLEQAIAAVGERREVDVVPAATDEQQPEYLWNYFARSRFLDSEGRTLFPIVVFDQFEEVFRNRRNDTEVLLRQIAYLMDESHALTPREVDGQLYRYDFNFRFVVSIREDDLYRLEDSIDNNYLVEMKRGRYRLRSLTDEGARAAILQPGRGLFRENEQDGIADKIIDKSRNEDGSISTNIVSLLCNRIYVEYQRSGADHITPSLVEAFIKGNTFEQFYNEATRGFSNREKSYIEDHLVDSSGRRNSLPEADFLLHVRRGAALLEGSRKILQRTSTSSDGSSYRIELIHDSFCEPLSRLKEQRERRRRIRAFIVSSLIAIGALSIAGYIFYVSNDRMRLSDENVHLIDSLQQSNVAIAHERDAARAAEQQALLAQQSALLANLQKDSTNEQLLLSNGMLLNREQALTAANNGLQYNMALALAAKASSLVDEGDSYLARMVALEALPPNRPYTAAAEAALRKAAQKDNVVLKGHGGAVNSAAFSPDGRRIVSLSRRYNSSEICIWDAITGKLSTTRNLYQQHVTFVSFSPDNVNIVVCSFGAIFIYDGNVINTIRVFNGHTGTVNSASFSPDGRFIVSASDDKTIRLWDAATGECLRTLKGHTDYVNSACFSPDGRQIVSASDDKTIRIWDAKTGECLRMVDGNIDKVCSASYSPDGNTIVSTAKDQTIRFFDAATGECLHTDVASNSDGVCSASYSPDGHHIVVATRNIIKIYNSRLFNVVKTLEGHTGWVNAVSYSPDGHRIVSASNDQTIRLWNVVAGECLHTLNGHTDNVLSASFSPDGCSIVSASYDHTIRIWDAATGRCLRILKGHIRPVTQASFSPDGQRIVSASDDIRLWDASTGECLNRWLPPRGVETVSFSSNGQYLVSTSRAHIVTWNVLSDLWIDKYEFVNRVNSASFSPNGKRILIAHDDGYINIMDISAEKLHLQGLVGHTGDVLSASFSPDGHRIVSSSRDKTIRIWDAASGECLLILEGHMGEVYSASYSPDGRHIVSASVDGTVRVWEVYTGECLGIFEGHTRPVYSASFSPDGRHIVSASDDGTVKIWDFLPLEELIEQTRERFKSRQLTPEERRKCYLE